MKKFKREFKNFNEIERLKEVAQEHTHKCKCGHSVVIYPFEKKQSKICRWCGKLVFADKKEEFKHKLQKELKKNEDKN